MMVKHIWFLVWAFIGVVMAASLAAGQEPAVVLHHLTGPVVLDGRIDEEAWRDVPPLPMVMSGPLYGAAPSQRTEVRVAYDERFMYVAGVFSDDQPGGVRSRSLTRDRWGDGDLFELIVDGYNDNENGTGFATNPAGVRIDFSISRDAESAGGSANPAVNTAWDAPWDVETVREPHGWTVEMRIPLSTLRFQSGPDGRVTMGLLARRYIARNNEHVTFPAIPERWAGGFQKPSLAHEVVLEGVRSTRPVYVTPFAVVGASRRHEPRETADAPAYVGHVDREIGMDLKYALADNLVLDLTANTDFAQAEADALQVNLTRFNLFFPEKRAFFLERAGVFNFQTRGNDRLFHSRRIGLGPDGRALRILGGARLVGRVGEWDIGALDMQTATSGETPSENFGVVRLRRRVLNESSYAGAMVTSRGGAGDPLRLGYGMDAQIQFGGSGYLSASFAQTSTGSATRLGSTAGVLSLERRSRSGLGLSQAVSWTGGQYDPPVGFVSRRGILLHESSADFTFNAPPEASLLRFGPGIETVLVVREDDRSVESVELAPFWSFTWKSGLYVDLEANVHMEDVREPFNLGETTIPVGRYWFRSARFFTSLPRTWTFNSRLYFRYGQFYDGDWTLLIVNPYIQPWEHLQLGVDFQRTDATFPGRGPFRVDLLRIRADVAFTRRISGGAFLQYASTSATAAANARLRYNFGEGRDLYIVYNEGLNVPDGAADPPLPLSDSRHLLLKVTYTLPAG